MTDLIFTEGLLMIFGSVGKWLKIVANFCCKCNADFCTDLSATFFAVK